jgi:D-glycero-alpha-D-manno-heptose 1-phosphate guanylyltransferase
MHTLEDTPSIDDMDVLLLVGGVGSRLRSIISDRPKPMAEIMGRPFLDIIIDHVSGFGFRRFVLCTGYLSSAVMDYYGTKTGTYEIVFSKEDKPLGTAGALKNAEELIQSSLFLVMNGDSFCPVDLSEFRDFHLTKNALVSMVVVEAENPGDYGLLGLDDTGRVIEFEEKRRKKRAFINAGIYLFSEDIFSLIPLDTKYSLEYDLFPKLIGREFYGFTCNEKLIDIGTPERYEQAKKILDAKTPKKI